MPASAHECAASATIDADPVITAAIVFATATIILAPNAMQNGEEAGRRPFPAGHGDDHSRRRRRTGAAQTGKQKTPVARPGLLFCVRGGT